MSPEIWTILSVGIAIAGLTLNSVRRLRLDLTTLVSGLDERMGREKQELSQRMDRDKQELNERMDRNTQELSQRMDRDKQELNERMDRNTQELGQRTDRDKQEQHERLARIDSGQGDLRERMAHLEGLLEGLREAITRNQAA